MSFSNDMRNAFSGTYRGLNRLLFVLVVVFLLINIIDAFQLMNANGTLVSAAQWLSIPGWFQDFLAHGWSLLTYMFTHESLFHLLGNALWLYFMGRMFTDFMGGSRMIGLFILGGVCGGIFFLLLAQVAPSFRAYHLLGASAG
ncbi:MAG: rhomboid family intramembrane serine protease, partial [Bacteroidia bacterium]